MIIETSDIFEVCALNLLKSSSVAIVSEKSHISLVKESLKNKATNSFEMPIILSLEGLDVSDLTNHQEQFLSRNEAFAILLEITLRSKIIPEEEAGVFVRAAIGELPNLYANGVFPQDIFERLPSTIPFQYEINLNAFVKIWHAFEVYLKQVNAKPYYAKQQVMLEQTLQFCKINGINLIIVDDFGRSPTIKNFIKKNLNDLTFIKYSRAGHSVVSQVLQAEYIPEEKVLRVGVQHILSQNENAKIGIICEDDALKAAIVQEFSTSELECKASFSNSSQSNPLVRCFLLLFGGGNISEIIPLFNIDEEKKRNIFEFFLNNGKLPYQDLKEIFSIYNSSSDIKKALEDFAAIKNFFIHTQNDFLEFVRFKNFILAETSKTQNLGSTLKKDFILHIASSWKIFYENNGSQIKIHNLRDAILYDFDFIILTSAYKTEPQGNILFSNSMRKYYGFDIKTSVKFFLERISCPIFSTVDIIEIPCKSIVLKEQTSFQKPNTKRSAFEIRIEEVPEKISATALEDLLQNPLTFYYKYIKDLREFKYTKIQSLVTGNLIHSILENAVLQIKQHGAIDAPSFVEKSFANVQYLMPFYFDDISAEISSILSLMPETEIYVESEIGQLEYTTSVANKIFTITCRPDRIDLSQDSITIYDYKSGSSKNYKSAIKNFLKVQVILPCFLYKKAKRAGVYKFIGSANEIHFEIDNMMMDDFKKITDESLVKYLEQCQPVNTDENSPYYKYIIRS